MDDEDLDRELDRLHALSRLAALVMLGLFGCWLCLLLAVRDCRQQVEALERDLRAFQAELRKDGPPWPK